MNKLKIPFLFLLFGMLALLNVAHGMYVPSISNIINLDPAFNAMTNPGIVFNQTTGLAYVTNKDPSGTNLGGNIIVVNTNTNTVVNTIAVSLNSSGMCGTNFTDAEVGGQGSAILIGKLLYFAFQFKGPSGCGDDMPVGIGAFNTQTNTVVMMNSYGSEGFCAICGYATSMTYDSKGIGFGNVPSILFNPNEDAFLQYDLDTNSINTTTYEFLSYVNINKNDTIIYKSNSTPLLNFTEAYTKNVLYTTSVNYSNPIYVNLLNNEIYYCDSNKEYQSGLDIFNGATGTNIGFIPMGYKCPTEGAAFTSSGNYLVVTTPSLGYGNVSIVNLRTDKDVADVNNLTNYKYYKSAPTDIVINNKTNVAYVVDSLGNLTTLILPSQMQNNYSTTTTISSSTTSSSTTSSIPSTTSSTTVSTTTTVTFSPYIQIPVNITVSNSFENTKVDIFGLGFTPNSHVQFGYYPIPPFTNVMIDANTNMDGNWFGSFFAPWNAGSYSMIAQDSNGLYATGIMNVSTPQSSHNQTISQMISVLQASGFTNVTLNQSVANISAPATMFLVFDSHLYGPNEGGKALIFALPLGYQYDSWTMNTYSYTNPSNSVILTSNIEFNSIPATGFYGGESSGISPNWINWKELVPYQHNQDLMK